MTETRETLEAPTSLTAPLRGTQFRPEEARNVVMGLTVGEALDLEREPDNSYDANAIKVLSPAHEGEAAFLGYVAREIAESLAPAMDSGVNYSVVVFGFQTPTTPVLAIELGNPEPDDLPT